ncbi:lipid A deacylase LpxR family protein [Litchfieldella xinjiangensis]|uniref:lipid A deacylase LpxR family protein n=1 Tax=Litchfieldella xinjiangensis TaxID=1166948 RepID=UPI0018CE153A|nr:lipid A deacylase LpxR family protein [Halomonas xinjiangensis]
MHRYLTHAGKLAVSIGLVMASTGSLADAGVFTFESENDSYNSSDDDHYTSGTNFTWSFVPEPDHWAQRLGNVLPNTLLSRVDGVSYRLEHRIYTPTDLREQDLIEDDRPYAGVTMLGLSLHETQEYGGWRQTTDVGLDVGLVGPGSGAKSIQREVHRVLHSRMPRGWDNQLDNEPLVNLGLRRQWWLGHRLGSLELEHGPHASAALGNLYTYAGGGYAFRVGQSLSRSSGIPVTSPGHTGRDYYEAEGPFSWFVFASLEGRYMAHNLLLDGNTWTDSHSVDRREGVGDASLGLAMTWDRWKLSLTSVWRTKEFEGQASHDKFGSLRVSRAF